jgi:hypothetical protein
MPTPIGLQESWEVRELPPAKPLDEAVWQAWLEKGRERDRRNSAARMVAVKWVSLAGLVMVAALWSYLGPYDVIARFVVAVGAIAVMFHAIHDGRYALAAVFAAVALLYNPVMPAFSFSGDWPRALVLASAVPFVASLTAPTVRKEPNA